MEEYEVQEGHNIFENGTVYQAGERLFTTKFRAEQLGLNEGKLKLVPKSEASAPLKVEDKQLTKDLQTAKDLLSERNAEVEKLKGENKAESEAHDKTKADLKAALDENSSLASQLFERNAEVEKLKGELEKLQNTGSEASKETAGDKAKEKETKKK